MEETDAMRQIISRLAGFDPLKVRAIMAGSTLVEIAEEWKAHQAMSESAWHERV